MEQTMQNKDYKKVAKLIIALGVEYAKDILKYFSEDEVKKVVREIIEINEVLPEERQEIIREFTLSLLETNIPLKGGYEFAKEMLINLYEKEKAESIISEINPEDTPLKFLEKIESEKIAEGLKNEHPQTIAIVLSLLNSKKGADILNYFPRELKSEVTKRIAIIEKSEPDEEMINEVIKIIKEKFTYKKEIKIKGLEKIIKILQEIDKKSQKEIIDTLDKEEPEIANIIKRELFRFEDIKNIDDRYIQRILREIESKDLVIALKGTSEELREKIFRNMSERGAEMIKDDMEATGPLKRQIVEEAQQRIISVIRRLEANGEIVIEGGNADVVV